MAKIERDLPRACEVCEHAKEVFDSDNILCDLCGIVAREYSCRKFSYDPLKRQPNAPRMPEIPNESEMIL